MANNETFSQRRAGSRVTFIFGDDRMDYTRKDLNGSRTAAIPYDCIAYRNAFKVKQRNVIFERLAAGLAIAFAFPILNNVHSLYVFVILPCIFIGVILLYATRAFEQELTAIPLFAPASLMLNGPVVVFQDRHSKSVLNEIESRWLTTMRKKYFRIDVDIHPSANKINLEQLRDLEVITSIEYEESINSLALGGTFLPASAIN